MTTLRCLYEDKFIYAIHKPPFIPFHSLDEPVQGCADKIAVEGVVSKAKSFLNDENIYPVHRLDKMTSGLMIFARTQEVNSCLSKAFAEKKIEKYYLAVSQTKPKKKQGTVIGDMAKGRSGSYLLKRTNDNPAVTRFFAKKIVANFRDVWFYVLKPETGKTHQLRVALKSLGSPVLGDSRYSGTAASRGYLHAYKIRFDLFDKRYELTDPYFEGEEFSLIYMKKHLTLASSEPALLTMLTPEILPWPKSSFILPANSL